MVHSNITHVHPAMNFAAAVLRRFSRKASTLLAAGVKTRAIRTPAQSRAEEADSVRELADSLVRLDPKFAQDLYAAATRHELAA